MKTLQVLALFVLVAAADYAVAAHPRTPAHYAVAAHPRAPAHYAVAAPRPPVHYAGPHTYHGHYPGQCHADGLYYRDPSSFVVCTNGLAYVQPCAPGTKNSGRYRPGQKYATQTFCDVNLNDLGFSAHRTQYNAHTYHHRPNTYFPHGYFPFGHLFAPQHRNVHH